MLETLLSYSDDAKKTQMTSDLVDNKCFQRFNFHHFHLVEISVYPDGQQQYGMKPLTTDFWTNV